jgi:hypothetical protein
VATYKPKLYSNVDAEVLEGVTYFRWVKAKGICD